MSAAEYLADIGVRGLSPSTTPFDPGYDAGTLEGHLDQSAHLMASLKISMACWMIAADESTRRKLAAARRHGVATIAGGGPFEVAAAQRALPEYLELCHELGFACIECAEGFTRLPLSPQDAVAQAAERGLATEYELGGKHEGAFEQAQIDALLDRARHWLDAGVGRIVVEARESAQAVGLFSAEGRLQRRLADQLAEGLGLDRIVFEAPTKASQFALIDHFGPEVQLGNVRLEEVLRVEIYRRGLHCDAFVNPRLRPQAR